MKNQTGDDYGLLLDKKYVNRDFWNASNETLGRRDNWNDSSKYVAWDKTSNSGRIFDFKGDLSALPSAGQALDRYHEGNSEYVRGVFPIQDVAGDRVGAIFVVRDITSFYQSMRRTEIMIAVLAVVAALLFTAGFVFMLSRLIFGRLETDHQGGDPGGWRRLWNGDQGQLRRRSRPTRTIVRAIPAGFYGRALLRSGLAGKVDRPHDDSVSGAKKDAALSHERATSLCSGPMTDRFDEASNHKLFSESILRSKQASIF